MNGKRGEFTTEITENTEQEQALLDRRNARANSSERIFALSVLPGLCVAIVAAVVYQSLPTHSFASAGNQVPRWFISACVAVGLFLGGAHIGLVAFKTDPVVGEDRKMIYPARPLLRWLCISLVTFADIVALALVMRVLARILFGSTP